MTLRTLVIALAAALLLWAGQGVWKVFFRERQGG